MQMSRELHLDTDIFRWKLRPPCPVFTCPRRMWPELGLDDLLVFLCTKHGVFEPVNVENDGHETPFFRWEVYGWRFP